MNKEYSDIIDRERPYNGKHPPLPLSHRAMQFSPFAALTGFDEEIAEEERVNMAYYEQVEKP